MDPRAMAEALARVSLFDGLEEPVLARLAAACVEVGAAKGEAVVVQGEPGDALLVLVAGSLAVTREGPGGERMVLRVLTPPESLGELALLDGVARSATVTADEDSRLLRLPREAFLELLRSEPLVFEPMLRTMASLLRRLTEQAADFVFLDLGGRVAKALLTLAADQLGNGAVPRVEVTQSRLAQMVGGTRQSVNQALATFGARGMVELEGRAIWLCDPEALRRRAKVEAAGA